MSNNSTSHNNNNSTSHNNNNNNTSLGGDHHLYNGHKVVAMPSLGGMSVQKVVTSRNETRSRSAGRTPRSRDIVQEVYDRMGVSRDDLRHSKADQFHERYRAAAALSTTNLHNNNNNLNTSGSTNGTPSSTTTTTTATRGRSMEPKDHRQTDGNRRARSLSRGRKISSLWPPTNSRTNAAAASGGGTGRENDNTSTLLLALPPQLQWVLPQQQQRQQQQHHWQSQQPWTPALPVTTRHHLVVCRTETVIWHPSIHPH